MPYQRPGVLTERTGLPGTPLGNTNFYIPLVIAKTLGGATGMSRTAEASGDSAGVFVNGQVVAQGDTLSYEKVTYNSGIYQTAALQRLPLVSVLSVSGDKLAPYKREFLEGTDFVVNKTTGVLDFSAAPALAAPELDNLTTAVGGSISADTYDVAVVALDANGNSTLSDSSSIVVSVAFSKITVYWSKVIGAAGYKIYAKPSSATAAQWALQVTVASGVTTSWALTDGITAGAITLPTTNASKHTPKNGDPVFVNYTYFVYNYNSPKRYFDSESIQQDHGIGSELANAGRLILGSAGVGNGAGSMYCVAPEVSNGEVLGYQAAIEACESVQELLLISTASASDAVNASLKQHCEDMSEPENARERFGVVSTTSAVMADTDISAVTNKILGLNGSNRMVFVVVDGGHPVVLNWQNTVDKYNVLSATTETDNYTANQAVDGQWAGIAFAGMVAALPDPATPPTNKQVSGISSGIAGTVRLWTDSRKDAVATVGGTVLEDRFNNLFVRHALTVSQASVEDSELSIMLAEGYMAKRLRDTHQTFVGKKLVDSLLQGVEATTRRTLDGLVADAIIQSYTNLVVYQDTVNPTWVYVKFEYKPVYPTNVIKFEWGFDLAG